MLGAIADPQDAFVRRVVAGWIADSPIGTPAVPTGQARSLASIRPCGVGSLSEASVIRCRSGVRPQAARGPKLGIEASWPWGRWASKGRGWYNHAHDTLLYRPREPRPQSLGHLHAKDRETVVSVVHHHA